MAKQLSLKQQIYQQIANKQVQEVLNKQREQETASLMADFNSWQQQRQDPAQLMADFDAWKQQNAAPQPQVQPQEVRQTIPSIADVQPVVHEQTEMEKHIAEVTKQAKEKRLRERAQKLQQLEQIEASQPHSKKERETLASIEDISKKLTNVVPETEALDTVTKTWRRGQRPEATDTSSQVAARVTNEKKPEIDTTNVPVEVDRWLSPDTKLTEAEKKKAKEYASAELQKVQYGPNKMPLLNTPEERQHYADMVNLINKTNGFTNFMSGAIEIPYNLADMVSDGARSVGNQLGGLGAAITDKLGVTEGATQRHNEEVEKANQFADQNEANMRQSFKNANTQNPGAYTAGKIAGQTGMYMLTNPVFDGIAAGAGVESELAKFFINQGAQNVQDLVLDTAPTVRQLMEDGSTPEEVKREALNNILWNVAGNAVMGGLGAWAGNRAARKASDEAFRENVRAGADNLSRIANEIPGIEDVDNVVRNATRQAEEATKNIEDIAQQIPKLPEENYATDIYKNTEPFSITKDPYYLTQEEFEAGQKRLQDYLNEPSANNKALTENYTKQNSFGSDIDNALNDIQSFIDGFSGEKELHKELTDSLDEVKNAIRNGGDIEGARAKLDNALNSAAEIVQQDNDSLLGDITSEAFNKVKSATDGSVIRLNKSVLKDALGDDAIFSDLNNMVYTGKGSIKFREGSGVPIDSIYNELRGLSDYELPEAHTEADQVAAIAKYISDVKAKNITPDNSARNEVKRLGNSLDEVIGNYNPNKVMAEEISKPKSDIITSEPIEPGKYEIPDTPENAPIDVPPVDGMKERGTSKHIRNAGTPMKMEGVADEVVADFEDNPDMYKVLKNADTKAKAEKIYAEADNPEIEFRDMLRKHDPAALPLGHQLAKDYSAAGNHEAAAQIYREMGEQLTKAGQFSQAAAINMMKNDPLTARAYFERELDALNKAGAEKYGKKWKDFVLTDEERAMFDKIAPGDSEAIKKAIDKIGVRIEKEYPASAWEKVLEFRRVAMLFNTRTIVRNTLANPPTAALRYVSDRIEALGQYAAHLIDPDFEVTQAIRGSNLETRKLAKEVYNSSKAKSLLEGGTGRLSEIPSVGDYAKSKQMFKGGFVSDWVNKMTNGGVEKLNAKLGKENAKSLLELTRSSAYKALEVTDNPMVRENFISRLGSYIRAKGIKNAADVPDEAILMAYEEAMKATYKDNSFMVQAIRNFKSGIERTGNHIIPGLGDMASQALIPYVQAPGNIAARTIDYSGIGFGKGIAKIVKGASANDVKMISKGIEEASKGATGSLMAALGYALYKSGVITGTYSNDNDQKAFEKKNGFREFAFRYKVNGQTKYDTIDWMQPFVDTIMPGVLLAQAIENSDEYDSDILRYFGFEGTKLGKVTGVAKEGVKKNVNYFFDSTPLKNLGELFKGNYGKETDLAGNLWENTVEDFASALVPAGVNAVTKSIDPVQRQTYDPSNAFGTFVNGVAAKLPKVSEALPVKYDTWGQPMTYGNSKGEAAFAKMLYPGEHTSDKADETDKELNRLFETTGSNAVFPQVAPSKVNGEKINNKEVSQYQQDVGVRNKLLVDGFINSSYYDALEDTDKADKIAKLYGVSKAITERDKFGKEVSEDSEYKKAIEAYDEAGGGEKGAKAVVDYYNAKAIADSSGLSANSNAYKEIMNEVLTGDEEKANELIEENKTANDMYAKYNLTGDENAAAVYNKAGENGLKYYSEFKSKGLTDYRAALTYDSATKEIKDKSKLPTMDDFIRGYKKIDSYGKSNGHVDQTEFLSFLNDGNYSDEQAAYYATLYGDWTTKPKISTRGKNKGKWIFGK